jgi:hypothetical protein
VLVMIIAAGLSPAPDLCRYAIGRLVREPVQRVGALAFQTAWANIPQPRSKVPE